MVPNYLIEVVVGTMVQNSTLKTIDYCLRRSTANLIITALNFSISFRATRWIASRPETPFHGRFLATHHILTELRLASGHEPRSSCFPEPETHSLLQCLPSVRMIPLRSHMHVDHSSQ